MRRIVAALLILSVVLAGGCVGRGTGLSQDKVLKAVHNIKTGEYSATAFVNASYSYPNFNLSGSESGIIKMRGLFDRTTGLSVGNISFNVRATPPGVNLSSSMPYFLNGSRLYLKLSDGWQKANGTVLEGNGKLSVGTGITGGSNILVELQYIEDLLKNRSVKIEKNGKGYYFRVNVTSRYLINASWIKPVGMSAKLMGGWIEVNLTENGTPYLIREHLSFSASRGGFSLNMTTDESIKLTKVNEPMRITPPKGLKLLFKRERLLAQLEGMRSYRSELTLNVTYSQGFGSYLLTNGTATLLTNETINTVCSVRVSSWVNGNGSVSRVLASIHNPVLGEMKAMNYTIYDENGTLKVVSGVSFIPSFEESIENLSPLERGYLRYPHLSQSILTAVLLHSNFTLEKTGSGYRIHMNLTNTSMTFLPFNPYSGKTTVGAIQIQIGTGNTGISGFEGYIDANFTKNLLPISYRIHASYKVYTVQTGLTELSVSYDLLGRFWDVNAKVKLPRPSG
ncbi:hypothetical protein [Thermococcus sp.]